MTEPIDPKLIPIIEQAKRELLSLIPPEKGGFRSPSESGDPWYPLKVGVDKQGNYAFIYSFDAAKPRNGFGNFEVKGIQKFTPEQEAVMRRAMAAAEDIAKVKFYEAGVYDPDFPIAEKYAPDKAFLCFFGAEDLEDAEGGVVLGLALGMEKRYGVRDIIVQGEDLRIGFHELTHAIPAGSHAEKTSSEHSVLGRRLEGVAVALGALDVLPWWQAYGKSTKAKVQERVVHLEESSTDSLLYREVPIILDLSKIHTPNITEIDLSNTIGLQVYYLPRDNKSSSYVTVAPGTHIKDIVANQDSSESLLVKGNALPNKLMGTILLAQGGNDILTGCRSEESSVMFRFDDASGKNNVITTFNVRDPKSDYTSDKIQIIFNKKCNVELQLCEDFTWQNQKRPATELRVVNEAGEIVASAFILDRKPEYIQDRISKITLREKWSDYNVDVKEESVPVVVLPPASREKKPATIPYTAASVDMDYSKSRPPIPLTPSAESTIAK